MEELFFNEFRYGFWFLLFLGFFCFAVMPFIGNEKEPDDNSKQINKLAAIVFLASMCLIVGSMFSDEPLMAKVFLRSIFLPNDPEQEAKLALLKTPAWLLILNSICIAAFAYFSVKVMESWLNDYARFLSKQTEERIAWFSALRAKHLTMRRLGGAFLYVFFFTALSTVLKACGITG